MLHFSKITDFSVELSPSSYGVYTAGELLSGQVVVELCKALKISALEVCARGLATVHWLETRSIGMNTVYSDFTAHETYLRKRHHLIRGRRSTKLGSWMSIFSKVFLLFLIPVCSPLT